MFKKSLALLLTLVMVLSLAPVSAFAAETTSYDTVQLPATLPEIIKNGVPKREIVMDGYITQGDSYHAFGVIGNNVFKEIAQNSTDQNYTMNDVGRALIAALTNTYYFAQDDTNYYFGIKVDRKSVNVGGYNYFISTQTIDLNFGFGTNDPTKYVKVSIPVKHSTVATSSNSDLAITSGTGVSYFCTEPAYSNGSIFRDAADYKTYFLRAASDNRSTAEGSVIGVSSAANSILGASVFTYEFSITKALVKTILGLGESDSAPSSIYFQASSSGIRYGSMNDLSLASMISKDSIDATFNLGTTNAPAKVEFTDVAANHEHNYVENPIDSFLVNKAALTSGGSGYYYHINPTSNKVLKCGDKAEYYKSCSICRTAGTEKFFGAAKAHSYVMRGDVVTTEITACDAEKPSRITYEYKCAWCDDTKVLPLGDYAHDYETTGATLWGRSYKTCQNQACGKVALVQNCSDAHTPGSGAFTNTASVSATCTNPATTLYICTSSKSSSYCAYAATVKAADANGHTAVIENTYDVSLTASEVDKAPTCEGEGVYFKTCNVCGAIDEASETFTVEANRHDEATLRYGSDANGHWLECDVCNGVGVQTTGHVFDQNRQDEKYLVKDSVATCLKGADYYISCICGFASDQTFEGSKGDISLHDFSDELSNDKSYHWNECTRCGATINFERHEYDNKSDLECNVCEYVRKAPATEAPVTEEPTTDAPATDVPATDEPTTDAPATEEPVTDEPATEEPVTEEPVTDKPATEEPVTDEPATEEPATENDCNGTISLAGLALVAALGTCTAFVVKKKED